MSRYRLFLTDVVGNAAPVEPEQTAAGIPVNVGVTLGVIVTVIEVGNAHGNATASGVNVYVVGPPGVAVLITAGAHIPVMPSIEAVASTGAVVFWQIVAGNAANVGVTAGVIVTVIEVGNAHGKATASGVNV